MLKKQPQDVHFLLISSNIDTMQYITHNVHTKHINIYNVKLACLPYLEVFNYLLVSIHNFIQSIFVI